MQVTVVKCDICGREIKTSPDAVIKLTYWDGHLRCDDYDLCEKCRNDILPNIYNIINSAKKGITVK